MNYFEQPNTQTVKVKLNNRSFKQFQLVIPGRLTISSVRIGTTTFCMAPGQVLYFNYKGENYELLTANSNSRTQSYNLSKLIRKRKKELGLS